MTPDWPELFVVRHGETDWNAEGRYQGSQDIPLNDRGRLQADQNGKLLARLLKRAGRHPHEFDWYCSPMGRTRETMERIRAAFAEPLPEVTYDRRLVEVSFGIYEGLLHVDLAQGDMSMAGERKADFWYFRPPNGESYEDVAQRILDFSTLLKRPSIIVAHGGILRVLRRLVEGFSLVDTVNWFTPQDSIVHFLDGDAQVYPAGESWDD
jgi:probable phosphoglycerate mutase